MPILSVFTSIDFYLNVRYYVHEEVSHHAQYQRYKSQTKSV